MSLNQWIKIVREKLYRFLYDKVLNFSRYKFLIDANNSMLKIFTDCVDRISFIHFIIGVLYEPGNFAFLPVLS